ncbi:hypothetical protein UFOVP84_173 [uncultured Caudovirales phage]|uniref:Uncharacterized protein n=1 Tax=uncultured Caudovirales phage TaxID=2100421 RepID=A0A6J5L4B4_9CAUD|nr:hypothetical protein UFOVP84_173 [uncultured Caudovirales phage]
MVISRFVEFVLVNVKMTNQSRRSLHKRNKRLRRSFCFDFGDVPVCNVNEQTKVWEDVVNPRGNAYALRNQLKYRSSKKEKLYKSFTV